MGTQATRSVALIYARRSFVRRHTISLAVEKQVEYCLLEATQRSYTPEIYKDDKGHRSGRHEKTRPAWMQVKERLLDPNVACLIVYEFDRASRSVRDTADLVELCQRRGVAIISIHDRIDTFHGIGSDEITYILMKAVWSQRESDKASDRQKDRVKYLKSKDVYWGSTPFGTVRTGIDADARMLRNPPYDATVVALMELYASGMSPESVRDELNQHGYVHLDRNKKPVPFRLGAVQSIAWNVLFYGGYLIKERRWKSKHSKIELSGEGTWLERYARAMGAERSTKIDQIISDELANRVIERRFMARRLGKTSSRWDALLTPILYYNGHQLRTQSRGYYYVYRTKGPGSKQFDGLPLDTEIVSRLSGIHFPEPLRERIRTELAQRDNNTERARLVTRITTIESKRDRLKRLVIDGFLTEEEFHKEHQSVESELQELRRALNIPTDIDQLMLLVVDLGTTLKLVSAQRRKQALQHLFEQIEINAHGEFIRLQPHQWARKAFSDLIGALRNVYLRCPRQDLNPQHPP